jgi:hypothetical protein
MIVILQVGMQQQLSAGNSGISLGFVFVRSKTKQSTIPIKLFKLSSNQIVSGTYRGSQSSQFIAPEGFQHFLLCIKNNRISDLLSF